MVKSRYFAIVTYVSEKQLRKVIRKHLNSVRAFCYITHDQDDSVPHIHLLMRLHSTWMPAQVHKWFDGLLDEYNQPVNTFVEICNDMVAQKDYILHIDSKSISEGKHLYSFQDIKAYGWDDLSERKDCFDSSYEILMKLIDGASLQELVRYYGRDFLYHYNQYIDLRDLIRQQELWSRGNILDADLKRFEEQQMRESANFVNIDRPDELFEVETYVNT